MQDKQEGKKNFLFFFRHSSEKHDLDPSEYNLWTLRSRFMGR